MTEGISLIKGNLLMLLFANEVAEHFSLTHHSYDLPLDWSKIMSQATTPLQNLPHKGAMPQTRHVITSHNIVYQ